MVDTCIMWCSWEPQIRARIRSHGAALIRGVRKIMFVITGSTHSTTHTLNNTHKQYREETVPLSVLCWAGLEVLVSRAADRTDPCCSSGGAGPGTSTASTHCPPSTHVKVEKNEVNGWQKKTRLHFLSSAKDWRGLWSATHLVAPPRDGGDDVATRWIPLHVRGHVMLCYVHHGAVWRVYKGESSVHTAKERQSGYIHVQRHSSLQIPMKQASD